MIKKKATPKTKAKPKRKTTGKATPKTRAKPKRKTTGKATPKTKAKPKRKATAKATRKKRVLRISSKVSRSKLTAAKKAATIGKRRR